MAFVLVVDDDPDIVTLVKLQLRRNGHETASASSGEEALEVLAGTHPDVAVLDIAMPGMDGLELFAELRKRDDTHDLPVIFLSARVRPEDIAVGKALGADYLTKPFVPKDLLDAIDRAVGNAA